MICDGICEIEKHLFILCRRGLDYGGISFMSEEIDGGRGNAVSCYPFMLFDWFGRLRILGDSSPGMDSHFFF